MDIDWGSAPEWITGLATAMALIFAGIQIRNSRVERHNDEQVRRETILEERLANTRAVSVRATFEPSQCPAADETCSRAHYSMEWELVNGGKFPIWQTVIVVGDTGTLEAWASQQDTAYEIVLGVVAAGDTRTGNAEVSFSSEPHYSELDGLTSLLFSDVWDQHWFWRPPELVRREQPARNC